MPYCFEEGRDANYIEAVRSPFSNLSKRLSRLAVKIKLLESPLGPG